MRARALGALATTTALPQRTGVACYQVWRLVVPQAATICWAETSTYTPTPTYQEKKDFLTYDYPT